METWSGKKKYKKTKTRLEKLQRPPRCISHPPINAPSGPAPHLNAKNQKGHPEVEKKERNSEELQPAAGQRKQSAALGWDPPHPHPGPAWRRRLDPGATHHDAGGRGVPRCRRGERRCSSSSSSWSPVCPWESGLSLPVLCVWGVSYLEFELQCRGEF